MISHDQCRDKIGEFLDQTLDPSERDAVAAHLDSCAPCAGVAREMTAIRATLRDFRPAPAPPQLRANVRAALQNQKAHTARPLFPWQSPRLAVRRLAVRQFAWSGTLAFSALALIVLARPFAQPPESFSESAAPATGHVDRDVTSPPTGSAPASKANVSGKNASRPSVAAKGAQPKANAQPDAQPNSKTPDLASKPRVETPFSEVRDQARRPAPETLAPPQAPPSGAIAPRLQRAQPSVLAPKPQGAPLPSARTLGRSSSPSMGTASRAKNAVEPPLPAPPAPTVPEPGAVAGTTLRSRVAHSANDSAAPPRADALAARAHSLADGNFRARESESGLLFSLQLKAAPAPVVAPSGASTAKNAAPSGVAPAVAPPIVAAPGTGTAPNTLDQAAEAPPAIASGAPAGARTLRPMPRQISPNRIQNGGSNDMSATFAAPRAENFGAAPSNRVRRYELQIGAARAVSNARVRLELPPSLRLVWPRSPVVWSGDLASEKATTIAFSLAEARGGEKISVVVEQKLASGQSSLLNTQTLILPMPDRE